MPPSAIKPPPSHCFRLNGPYSRSSQESVFGCSLCFLEGAETGAGRPVSVDLVLPAGRVGAAASVGSIGLVGSAGRGGSLSTGDSVEPVETSADSGVCGASLMLDADIGGHGPPPEVRGKPCRNTTSDDAVLVESPFAGALCVDTASETGWISDVWSAAWPASVLVTGGHGAPPGVRGSPRRRTCVELIA